MFTMGYRSFGVAQCAVGPVIARSADAGHRTDQLLWSLLHHTIRWSDLELVQLTVQDRKLGLFAIRAAVPVSTVQTEG